MTSTRLSARFRRRIYVMVGRTPVFTCDVGPEGFSAELMRIHPPGTQVQGSIRLDGREVGFTGTVVWAKAGAAHMSIRGRIGVRFTGLPPEARTYLGTLDLAGSR